jgi:hypothetical protein
MAKKAKVMT